ncbi:MAG: glycosyltransferase family 1 protein [Bryobacteraceae bacterium]|nr:glycosyltransferase family 1 protein [Bryobacteraceae bacterium]
MSRIVLSTMGSYGDVHPYLAVGLALKDRGRHVTIATSEHYRRKVEGEGLCFAPIRPDFVPITAPPEIVRRSFDPRGGANFVLKSLVLPFVGPMYADLLRICRGANLLVVHPTLFAGPLVAEKLGLRWVSVLLSPAVFVSAYDPPVFPPFPWFHHLRHLGPFPHKLMVRVMKLLTRPWTRSIAELRAREGLRPPGASAMHDDMFSPFGTLGWFSPLIAPRQPDWPQNTQITGFTFYDRRSPGEGLHPALAAFLDDGEPPVVFTLGSSAVGDAGDFYVESLGAVRRLRRRAVFLVRDQPAPTMAGGEPPGVFVTDYAPYSQLLPRAAAVVHQGGIGTVAQVMKAGVPMLVAPRGLDQPDNANRVRRLGIARVLSRSRYSAARAARELDRLLGDPRYARAAREAGAAIAGEDGVEAACDALERICDAAPPEHATRRELARTQSG